jgi:hypothetical protein
MPGSRRLESRARLGNFDLPAQAEQFVISRGDFVAGAPELHRNTVSRRPHRSGREASVRIRLDGKIPQGADGPARSAAIAAMNERFSRSLHRVFDSDGEATAIDTYNLEIDTAHEKNSCGRKSDSSRGLSFFGCLLSQGLVAAK